MMDEMQCEPEKFSSRIIFMSMFNDIVWRSKENKEMCIANSLIVAVHSPRFPHGNGSFLGPGSEKKWCGSNTHKPNGEWDNVSENVMLNFSESGHPVLCGTSGLERGTLMKSTGGGNFVYTLLW